MACAAERSHSARGWDSWAECIEHWAVWASFLMKTLTNQHVSPIPSHSHPSHLSRPGCLEFPWPTGHLDEARRQPQWNGIGGLYPLPPLSEPAFSPGAGLFWGLEGRGDWGVHHLQSGGGGGGKWNTLVVSPRVPQPMSWTLAQDLRASEHRLLLSALPISCCRVDFAM